MATHSTESDLPSKATLFLLMGVMLLHLIDRQIMAILAEPIKLELGFSDTQIGLLTGIGFSLLYSILGIPIARLADRYDRAKIITIATASWSAMTVVTGMTGSFISMLLARMGVAVGEAGGIPPLHSLVADLYPEEKRARAFSIVQLGGPIGILVAFLGGGFLVAHFDWRAVFYAAGFLGIGFAVLLYFFLPEPRRNKPITIKRKDSPFSAMKLLLMQPIYFHLVIGTALAGLGLYAMIIWFPSFLLRSYDLPITQVGILLGVAFGVFGGIAVLAVGHIADKRIKKDRSAHALIPAQMMLLAAPFMAAGLWVDSLYVALALLFIPVLMSSSWHSPTFAAIQKVAGNENRALATALSMLILNLIGLGLGPLVVGILSDYFEPEFGKDSLQVALLVVPVAFLWASIHWFIAAKKLRQMTHSEQV